MNTDQAYELLKIAGVAEDVSIQTIRRWLREKKIKYEGRGYRKTEYIPDDTEQAFNLLKDAGVTASIGIPIVRRWLREDKLQNGESGSRKSENIQKEIPQKPFINNPVDQDKVIQQLKVKIKAQDDHITGLEELHQNSIKTLIKQREKLHKEIANLEIQKSRAQNEAQKLLKENIEVRTELLKLKEELFKGNYKDADNKFIPSGTDVYRQKLGLSRKAGHKEVLAGYKKLLKVTHPDHGGDAAAFHYIKTDFDLFRNSLKRS